MTLYRAYIDKGHYPHNRKCTELEATSFKKLKADLIKNGFGWAELEMPRGLLPGHYFTASKGDARLEIYKVRA